MTGDMRRFRSDKKFPLAIIPFRAMQHMYTVQDQVDALTAAAAHLREDGRLAFDVFYPKFHILEAGRAGDGGSGVDGRRGAANGPAVFPEGIGRQDSAGLCLKFIFRTYEGEKLVQEEIEPLKLGYYTYPHLRALFLLAGLEAAGRIRLVCENAVG